MARYAKSSYFFGRKVLYLSQWSMTAKVLGRRYNIGGKVYGQIYFKSVL